MKLKPLKEQVVALMGPRAASVARVLCGSPSGARRSRSRINTPFFDKARTRLGVKPKGFPPMYSPGVVADTILYAAENGPRDIVAGGAAKSMILGQRLSPRLMDAVLLRGGFGSQMTDEPKCAEDPDALFEPMQGQNRTEGDFDYQTLRGSLTTWLDTHPAIKRAALTGAALGTLALLKARPS